MAPQLIGEVVSLSVAQDQRFFGTFRLPPGASIRAWSSIESPGASPDQVLTAGLVEISVELVVVVVAEAIGPDAHLVVAGVDIPLDRSEWVALSDCALDDVAANGWLFAAVSERDGGGAVVTPRAAWVFDLEEVAVEPVDPSGVTCMFSGGGGE